MKRRTLLGMVDRAAFGQIRYRRAQLGSFGKLDQSVQCLAVKPMSAQVKQNAVMGEGQFLKACFISEKLA